MKILLMMGLSSSGKDTIKSKLLECSSIFKFFIPYTTRSMRPGEENGKEYFFVNELDIANKKFVD